MSKFYKVIKTSFLWEKDAILKYTNSGSDGGYEPISDIWDTTEHNGGEYISSRIIENNPDWFQRVYSIDLLTKTVYKTKEEAKVILNKEYRG